MWSYEWEYLSNSGQKHYCVFRCFRYIKGVIKVGQSDDENIFQELDEYVVTSELEKYMDRFFAAYKRGVESRTDK